MCCSELCVCPGCWCWCWNDWEGDTIGCDDGVSDDVTVPLDVERDAGPMDRA
jgi:hypothetical protein